MNKKKPNIITFKTKKNNQYIYDACTNRIFPAPEPYPEILEMYNFSSRESIISKFEGRFGKEYCENACNQIEKWVKKDNAFFSYETEIPKFSYTEEEYWSTIFKLRLPQLCLNVTDDCNFRCKYCGYSGQYDYWRTHQSKYMDFDIAKKSLDYFLNILTNYENTGFEQQQRTISFYGGEPLLNFKLIKEVVNYVNRNFKDKNIVFSLTTNGSLLNDEIIDFFEKHGIIPAISFDGPEEEHDRNRVFKSGKGTHDIVFKNIQKIRKKHPEYFKEKASILSCYDWGTNLLNVNRYFEKKEKCFPKNPRFNPVSFRGSEYYKRFSKKDYSLYKKRFEKLKYSYISFLSNPDGKKYFTSKGLFSDSDRTIDRAHCTIIHYTSICTPGTKVFVAIDGSFHICERINSKFPIGNCYTGLDFKKIFKIKKEWHEKIIEKNKCNVCTARHFCQACYVAFAEDGYFQSGNECELLRNAVEKNLNTYYSITEINPRLIEKVAQDITILDS